MKKTLRIISLAAALMMLLAVMPAGAEAAPMTEQVVISAGIITDAVPGGTVSVPIVIGGGDYMCHSLVLKMYYDVANLTVVSVSVGEVWTGLPMDALKMYDYRNNPGTVAIAIASPTDYFSAHGTLLTVNFNVSASCTQDQPLTVDINQMTYEPVGEDIVPVPAVASNGLVALRRCTVTFFDPIADEVIDWIEVPYGSAVGAPDAPEHEGYVFEGWDTDLTCVTEDLFVSAVYESTGPQLLVGDANLDGTISFADVAALYNLIFAGDALTAQMQYVCDVNGDGSVSFVDVAALYNYVLAGA